MDTVRLLCPETGESHSRRRNRETPADERIPWAPLSAGDLSTAGGVREPSCPTYRPNAPHHPNYANVASSLGTVKPLDDAALSTS